MKNLLKYILFMCVAINLLAPACLNAATQMTIANYHPSVHGKYDRIRMLPRAADLTTPCIIGTMYVNASGIPRYCFNDGTGIGVWGTPPEIWTQNGDNIYLTDTSVNTNINVGIGTTTPVFKLTIQDDPLIIANGTFGSGAILPNLSAGSRLIWYPRKAAFRAGYVSGTQWDDANMGDYSIAMGKDTTASGIYSVAAGGDSNIASGQYATSLGGQTNTASGNYSAIMGGKQNTASGHHAMIYGGLTNQATSDYTLVVGGKNNQATAVAAAVGGGEGNIASNTYAFIGGGYTNLASGIYSVVGGGRQNLSTNDYTTILGGDHNVVISQYGTIGGGFSNNVGGWNAGLGRYVGQYGTITGGRSNSVQNDYSTITGGLGNTITGAYSTIGGGAANSVSGDYSFVGGGTNNSANGLYSMVLGGTKNIASGDYSLASGYSMQLGITADHTFAWGLSDNPISVTTPDIFVLAPGTVASAPWNPSVGIRDVTPGAVLEVNAAGTTDDYINITNPTVAGGTGNIFTIKNNGYIGVNQPTPTVATHLMQFGNANGAYLSSTGVWTSTSSRKYKENIKPLSSEDAEDTLDKLVPVTFNYKTMRDQQNVGFIAEDVPDLVATKERKSLSTMDIVAVLTQTVKDQEKQIQKHKEDMQEIREAIQKMKERLN